MFLPKLSFDMFYICLTEISFIVLVTYFNTKQNILFVKIATNNFYCRNQHINGNFLIKIKLIILIIICNLKLQDYFPTSFSFPDFSEHKQKFDFMTSNLQPDGSFIVCVTSKRAQFCLLSTRFDIVSGIRVWTVPSENRSARKRYLFHKRKENIQNVIFQMFAIKTNLITQKTF